MRKSHEQIMRAIDTMIVSMGHVVMLTKALDEMSIGLESDADLVDREEQAIADVRSLFSGVQTVDVTGGLLHKMVETLADDVQNISPQKVAQQAIRKLATQRLGEVKAYQAQETKILDGVKLDVTVLNDNIVQRNYYGVPGELKPGFEPIMANETFTLRAGMGYGPFDRSVVFPQPGCRYDLYRGFKGFALQGYYVGKGKANRSEHLVSLVDDEGAPQVVITPSR